VVTLGDTPGNGGTGDSIGRNSSFRRTRSFTNLHRHKHRVTYSPLPRRAQSHSHERPAYRRGTGEGSTRDAKRQHWRCEDVVGRREGDQPKPVQRILLSFVYGPIYPWDLFDLIMPGALRVGAGLTLWLQTESLIKGLTLLMVCVWSGLTLWLQTESFI
jgi:hypothetical protein